LKISGYLGFSLIDYPGIPSFVIFTQGCNFRCPFCHNPELISQRKKGQYSEEFILDKNENICKEVFEFYNRLNKRFRGYYSEKDIVDILESLGYDFKIESLGNGILVIEKIQELSRITSFTFYLW